MPNIKHMGLDREMSVKYSPQLSNRQKFALENDYSHSTGAKYQKYYIETKVYITDAKISSDCADILFINQGSTTCFVQDIEIQVGQTWSIGGTMNEIDTTQYIVRFALPFASGNKLIVARKMLI